MEVVHIEDHVTSAIIGGSEKIDYTIEDGAFFMQMLSSSLYKDQMLAVVREVVCNADDAHKMGAGTDKHIELTLTNEKFVVRDFGPGIAHDQIGPIYAKYGKSTKTGQKNQTGGFGLGCKAPFAYTDNFQVTSWHNGLKTIYRMSKSDSEVQGKPSIIKILQVPTTESGLEVSINLNHATDKHRFASRLKQVVANGGMKAKINGVEASVIPFDIMKHGYMITDHDPLDMGKSIYVRYGAVVYPVEDNDTYNVQYYQVKEVLRTLNRQQRNHDFCIILQADADSLSLTPSREGLTISELTTATLIGLFEKFLTHYRGDTERDCKILFKEAIDKTVQSKDVKLLLHPPGHNKLVQKYVPTPKLDGKENYFITDTSSLAKWNLHIQYPGEHDRKFLCDDVKRRAGLMVQHDLAVDRGLMRRYHRALTQAGNMAYRRHSGSSIIRNQWFRDIVAPVLAALKKGGIKDGDELQVMVPCSRWGGERSYYSTERIMMHRAVKYTTEAFDNYFLMQKRVVVLTHNADAASDMVEYTGHDLPDQKHLRGKHGYLVYQVGRAKAKVELARLALSKLKGYLFIDLTKSVEYREPKARKPKEITDKLKGYASLNGVRDGILFDWQRITKTTQRVEKPLAYADLYGKSHHRTRDHIVGIDSRVQAQFIADLYGDQIAAVFHGGAIDTLKKKGVKSIREWLPGQLVKELGCKDLLAALPGSAIVFDRWLDDQDVDTDFVNLVLDNEELREVLKVPALCILTDRQKLLLKTVASFRFEKGYEAVDAAYVTNINPIVPTKGLVKFVKSLEGNKLLSLVDTDQAVSVFAPGVDPEHKAKVLKLIKLALKG